MVERFLCMFFNHLTPIGNISSHNLHKKLVLFLQVITYIHLPSEVLNSDSIQKDSRYQVIKRFQSRRHGDKYESVQISRENIEV